MLVFIDESGDPGFKLEKGSSPIFVAAMVIFVSDRAAASAQAKISVLMAKLRVKPEFKFNKCKDDFRDAFFNEIAKCRFVVRAVVVRKGLIHSRALQTVTESFYKFFVRMMMEHDGGVLENARVVIDGSGDRRFKRQLKTYIRRHFTQEAVKECELRDSVRDPLVQLADMAAGAIARAHRTDRANSDRWLEKLKSNGQISNIWKFR
jgi:hypothetical protein